MLEPKNGTYVIRALLCYTVMLSNESKINKIYETQHPLAFNVWYIRHMERHMERRNNVVLFTGIGHMEILFWS